MDLKIADEFGYVVLVFVASIFLLQWMGFMVVKARKKHNVPYPAMYSDKDPMFNCVQRAHQNTLEAYPIFLVTMFLGGLRFPVVGALAGVVWLVSRVVYAKGYYTGDPSKRNRGAFGYIGLITNLICTIMFGLQLLGVA